MTLCVLGGNFPIASFSMRYFIYNICGTSRRPSARVDLFVQHSNASNQMLEIVRHDISVPHSKFSMGTRPPSPRTNEYDRRMPGFNYMPFVEMRLVCTSYVGPIVTSFRHGNFSLTATAVRCVWAGGLHARHCVWLCW